MDDEKDLYIMKRLKNDKLISKKADDVFNNFLKEDFNVEENKAENNVNPTKEKSKYTMKNKITSLIAGISSAAILLGGAGVYASTQGYGNLYFMIKYLITKDESIITDKDELLSDKEITISYEKIGLTENVSVLVEKLQIKDNKAKLVMGINALETDVANDLQFTVYNANDEKICEHIDEGVYTHNIELDLEKFEENENIIKLEIAEGYKEYDFLARLIINIEEQTVEVEGQAKGIEKISEIELKRFLALITEMDDAVVLNISEISYCSGIYTATFNYSQISDDYLSSDKNIDDLKVYQNTAIFKLDDDNNFVLVSLDNEEVIESEEYSDVVKDDDVIVCCITPSGWAGSSNYKAILKLNGDAYVYCYDGNGNIISENIIAQNINELYWDYTNQVVLFYGPNLTQNDEQLANYKNYKNWVWFTNAEPAYLKNELNNVNNATNEVAINTVNELEAIFKYESGDRNAVNGDPETLKIYEMNNYNIEFTYHAVWNSMDITGSAILNDGKFIYEKDNNKIIFNFNEKDGDTVTIREYENEQFDSEVTLYKVNL